VIPICKKNFSEFISKKSGRAPQSVEITLLAWCGEKCQHCRLVAHCGVCAQLHPTRRGSGNTARGASSSLYTYLCFDGRRTPVLIRQNKKKKCSTLYLHSNTLSLKKPRPKPSQHTQLIQYPLPPNQPPTNAREWQI